MMCVNQLSSAQWNELRMMLQRVGMEKLALTTTLMCQRYLGIKSCFPGCEEVDPALCDDLMAFILAKGNSGQKAGFDGKMASFSLTTTGHRRLFKRLQTGGILRWKAAKKYVFLRPFAWIYQTGAFCGAQRQPVR